MLKISVNTSSFSANLARFAVETQQEFGKVLRQQARLLCVKLAQATRPPGVSADVRRQIERAIEKDISKVGKSISYFKFKTQTKWEKGFVYALKNSDLNLVEKLIKGTAWENSQIVDSFDPITHTSQRVKGKVPKKPSVTQIVTGKGKSLDSYKKEKIKNAGLTKGGWAACASKLGGTRGIPAWISRHNKFGTVNDKSNSKTSPYVELINDVKSISELLPASASRDALVRQIRDFESYMQRYLDKKYEL